MSVDQQPINRVPAQLLRFLGISGAESPDRLQANVQGVTDLLPWWSYSLEQDQTAFVSVGVATVGYFNVMPVVPPGQRQLVTALGFFITLGAGGSCAAIAAVETAAGLRFFIGQVSIIATAPSLPAQDSLGPRPNFLILSPGDRLGIWVTQSTGAAAHTVTMQARFSAFIA